MTTRRMLAYVVAGCMFTAGVLAAQDSSSSKRSGSSVQTKSTFASPEIAVLNRFVDTWLLKQDHFDEQGKVIASVKGTEEIVWTLNKRVIRRNYKSGQDDSLFRATGQLSWNKPLKQYVGYWFDSISTAGPTRTTGKWNQETNTMVFTLDTLDASGATSRYRVVEQFVDEEHRVATTYLLKGDEVIKRMEVRYRRAVPCPGGPRIIGGPGGGL